MAADPLPPDFVRFTVRKAEVTCVEHVADAVREALHEAHTLYRYAANHPDVRWLAGRGVVYAAPLPDDVERVVVRHNHHGGKLAPITRDLFRPPTRAPHELLMSERLRAARVPTPVMLGYVLYRAPAGLQRVDVMTREVPDSFDLAVMMMSRDSAQRARTWLATAEVVRTLSEAGARHHDLNVKNVLLHDRPDAQREALVIDVDRVKFGGRESEILDANLERLLRSARKWQELYGAPVTDAELEEFASTVRDQPAALSTRS